MRESFFMLCNRKLFLLGFICAVVLIIVFLACFLRMPETEQESGNLITIDTEENSMESAGDISFAGEPNALVVWEEDVTHDGIPERIEVDLSEQSNPSLALSGWEETVKVYSGQTGEKIWSAHADTVHAGWNGIYIYKAPENGQVYLLIWQPMRYTERADYTYRLISLLETGEEQVKETGEVQFDLNSLKAEDEENVSVFLEKVNRLLKDSYVLLDTDNADFFYSPKDHPVTKEYDAKGILSEIRQRYAQQ